MTLRGTLRNGMIQLDAASDWPEGTPVTVARVAKPRSKRKATGSKADQAFRLSDLAIPMGEKDLAAEHDHYLYGTPKRSGAKPAKRAKRTRSSNGRR